jgi:hypothetical protein
MFKRLAICVALVSLTTGCVGGEDSKKADAAADRFYQQLAAKQYQAIYDDAAPELRNAIQEPVLAGFLARIDRKFGDCQPPVKNGNWRFNMTTNGYFNDQGYTRSCAKGQLNETVSVVVRGGVGRLTGYHADSPLLLTD